MSSKKELFYRISPTDVIAIKEAKRSSLKGYRRKSDMCGNVSKVAKIKIGNSTFPARFFSTDSPKISK